MLIKIFTDGKYEIFFHFAGKFLNIFFYHIIIICYFIFEYTIFHITNGLL